ncbi:PREDICTED: F-box/FBD/LRR-repeat protein At1g13570 [Ipomoea nil]|uniref:F-box/FBD/LRR-repeat protein At1g13570 n=1 Tax=Ipomoea nil TaxID=35883 RepID=UPI000901ECB6|nr:PREDICTED: F-box/FBD/LRR-repeat protein At1g13570 [Ipomoea nil]XP_019149821.1 PREDICTED: F-box/FBD/LRR-repeat protein At1g13570 [Ipomoea nil]
MDSERDLISDLPQSIIEAILEKVPIRDAVMTSALSTKWRYKWSGITELVFDDSCVSTCYDKSIVESNFIHFITRCLFLHNGPIHKFALSSSYLPNTPDIDQWLLFLSRKDVKELSIELGEGEWFKAPSYFFSCKKLTRLELVRCELDPPLNFKGFMCLKHLNLQQVVIPPCDIENLISSCPLLENLELSYFDSLELTIRAPKLRYLNLEGEFKEICLENTPNLVGISVAMYMTDDIAEHFEQSSGCNFDKFLGNVPLIEHLTGHIYFTKYLSIGNDEGSNPMIYNHLKVLELYQVSFEDMKEIYVVLRMILSSPNLEQLLISGSTITASTDIHDLEFWEKGLPADCTFHKLKVVKISDFSAVLHEMAFIKFLLLNSPVLESMTIAPSFCIMDGKLKMLIELLSYRRASPLATIKFVQEQA